MFGWTFILIINLLNYQVFSMGEDLTVTFEMEISNASFPSKNFHPYQLSCDMNDNFYVMERHSKKIHVIFHYIFAYLL